MRKNFDHPEILVWKIRHILIKFVDNCGYFPLILLDQSSTNDRFSEINCVTEHEHFSMKFCTPLCCNTMGFLHSGKNEYFTNVYDSLPWLTENY